MGSSRRCAVCAGRAGTANRDGLKPREGTETLYRAHYALAHFTCQECGQNWALVTEIGSGRPNIFIEDSVPADFDMGQPEHHQRRDAQ
jgi:hypothetical protein